MLKEDCDEDREELRELREVDEEGDELREDGRDRRRAARVRCTVWVVATLRAAARALRSPSFTDSLALPKPTSISGLGALIESTRPGSTAYAAARAKAFVYGDVYSLNVKWLLKPTGLRRVS